jgi:hypothetical protein
VLLALVALVAACAVSAAAASPRRATWVWDNWVVETPEKQQDFLRFCRARRIDTVFLHAPADHLRERAANFHSLLAAAHRQKMRVEALDGRPEWAFERARAEAHVAAVLAFNLATGRPGERFDGIHLDVEPYDMPQWKAARQSAAAQYLEMLDVVRTEAGGLPLSADVPPWFGEVEIPEGTVLSGTIARVSTVALMAYTDQIKGLRREGRPAVEFAQHEKKQVWIGISAQLRDSDMDLKRPVREQVEAVIKRAEHTFRGAPGLAGVAVHDYEHLRALYDKEHR